MRILLLERDVRVASEYSSLLRADGQAVDEVATLSEARRALTDVEYDCAVLDRTAPDGDALELLDVVAELAHPMSTLFLAVLGDGGERVTALKAGADDCLVKPVLAEELVLRVRKLLARRTHDLPRPVHLGRVVVDPARRQVAIDGTEVHLTRGQYAVLDYLVANRDRMVEIQELLDHCWDRNRDFLSNPLHTQITRLRRVFKGTLRFECVRGSGYLIHPEE